MLVNLKHANELRSQEQTIKARVELYSYSTLAQTDTLVELCNCGETLSDFTVEKTGEQKYFGFGVCQKINATLIDIHNSINMANVSQLEAAFGVDDDFIYPFPRFYIQEIERDEVFNTIKITAYDALYKAANHTVSELKLLYPYNLKNYAGAIGAVLGLPVVIDDNAAEAFELEYTADFNVNFEGSETLRAALDALAEVTQTIYYIDNNWNLRFKRLEMSPEIATYIYKSDYFELTDNGTHTLAAIGHTTELGDNIVTDAGARNGDIQYFRDNPFLENRNDKEAIVSAGGAAMAGLSIDQFRCDWKGNYLLEIGDKVVIYKDDNTPISTYIIDDTITYDGALWQIISWAYGGSDAETAANTISLSDTLKKTEARVDKTTQEIALVAQESAANYTELKQTTSSIGMTVQTNSAVIDGLSSDMTGAKDKLAEVETNIANFKIEADEALLEFKTTIEKDGVTKVSGTGFSFSEDGLKINKTDSNISTTIDNDGMTVDQNGSELLVADNNGVSAKNLHATTYIYIGNNSRLEDYTIGGKQRTACFWYG